MPKNNKKKDLSKANPKTNSISYYSDVGLEGAIEEVDNLQLEQLTAVLDDKAKDLSKKGYSETNGSDTLIFEEIRTILSHKATSRNTPNKNIQEEQEESEFEKENKLEESAVEKESKVEKESEFKEESKSKKESKSSSI
ncbi:15887_t:CDS:2 [Gigaspora margarita]|uniref:15887_t:CDS:1 n=1 Tax=Gigaspora margarita TaxID=4874 RepID=A0ABN7UNH9_GIGMA|nr:15887_t:CDS:2 [Gigaspora margarita]